ncbi:MAG TPA: RICIN domain-containing protein, partial [Firmicutes bacterium]|nr:RICIN domain-containing protein [Bacillota bacterium]
VYYLRNAHSNLYLDVNANKIRQYKWNGGRNQQWRLVDCGNGEFKLESVHYNKVINVAQNVDADRQGLVLYESNSSLGQFFKIIRDTNNSVRIMSKNSNFKKCLNVSGGSTAEGADIIQYTYYSSHNGSKWFLEPAVDVNIYYDHSYVRRNNAQIEPGKVYYIRSALSDLYLDANKNVIQYTANYSTVQQWRVLDAGDGTYKLESLRYGKVINVAQNVDANRQGLVLYESNSSSGQFFKIVKNSNNNSFAILTKCSNYTKGLNVYDGSKEPEAQIIQYQYRANELGSQWYFEPVNGSTVAYENTIKSNLRDYVQKAIDSYYAKTNVRMKINSITKKNSPVDGCTVGLLDAHALKTNIKQLEWLVNTCDTTKALPILFTGVPNFSSTSSTVGGVAYHKSRGLVSNYRMDMGIEKNTVLIMHELAHNWGISHHPYNNIDNCVQGMRYPSTDDPVIYNNRPNVFCDDCLRTIIQNSTIFSKY